jgi:hypothetical protein
MYVRRSPLDTSEDPAVSALATTSPAPYATLLSFTRYVGRTGPAKATFVTGLRRQRESGSGFNPHGQLIKALKADIQFRTGGTHLAQVVTLVKPRWRPLYETLTAGAAAYLESLGDLTRVRLVPVRDALAVVGGLTVKVNPHLGLRYEDGHGEVVRLHFDEQPPGTESLVSTLHLMARHADQMMPRAEPVLVDVRRGQAHRREEAVKDPAARDAAVEQWLAGEAVGFSAMWSAIPPRAAAG